MQSWARPIQRDVVMLCGICGVKSPTWTDRVEHISAHFTAGQDMSFWLWVGMPGGVTPRQQTSQTTPPKTGFPHKCQYCGDVFARYIDGIWHERQFHNRYVFRMGAADNAGINPKKRTLQLGFSEESRFPAGRGSAASRPLRGGPSNLRPSPAGRLNPFKPQ